MDNELVSVKMYGGPIGWSGRKTRVAPSVVSFTFPLTADGRTPHSRLWPNVPHKWYEYVRVNSTKFVYSGRKFNAERPVRERK